MIAGCVGLLFFGLLAGYAASNWINHSTLFTFQNKPIKKDTLVSKAAAASPAATKVNAQTMTAPPQAALPLSTPIQATPALPVAPTVAGNQASKQEMTAQNVAPPNNTLASTEQQSAPAALAPLESSNTVSKPADALATPLLAQRLAATSQWLPKQSAELVTIQMMGGSDDAQLNAQLELLGQQLEVDKLYVYRTKTNQTANANAAFTVVLYGSYASRLQAMQALKQLPESIQKNKPQLRTVAGVLAEIK